MPCYTGRINAADPVVFLFGPEGFGRISPALSLTLHHIFDLFSKNIWGLLGHFLRRKVGVGDGHGMIQI